MTSDLIEYSGLLTYPSLSADRLQAAERIVQASGLEIALDATAMEIEYAGRDAGRAVVALLQRLAPVIGDAEGEIVCELSSEQPAGPFEFYSIRGDKLLRQQGQIIRGPREELTGMPEPLHSAEPARGSA